MKRDYRTGYVNQLPVVHEDTISGTFTSGTPAEWASELTVCQDDVEVEIVFESGRSVTIPGFRGLSVTFQHAQSVKSTGDVIIS